LLGEKNGKDPGTKYNFVAISANQNQKKTQHTLKFSHLTPYFLKEDKYYAKSKNQIISNGNQAADAADDTFPLFK
jgi:hypothetical protein